MFGLFCPPVRSRSLATGLLLTLAVCALATFGLPMLAFAAAVTAAANTTVPVGDVYGDLLPYLSVLAGIVVSLIVGWLSWGLNRLIGVSINAKMSQVLHDTLFRAATYALDTIGSDLKGTTFDTHSEVVARAIAYVRTYRPDLLKRFGLTDAQLADLLRVHLSALVIDAPKGASPGAA